MRFRKRSVSMGVLLAVVVGMIALGAPANAFDCDGVEVERVDEDSSRLWMPGTQELQLGHATATYTVEGESLPFFRFVSSWIERPYVAESGEVLSVRSGRDEGFIGHTVWSDWAGDHIVEHGHETLQPDELACEALTR